MSGLDEQEKTIPQCPNCGKDTNFWSVYKEEGGTPLLFLNYRYSSVKHNEEFNLKFKKSKIVAEARYMICVSCDYLDNDRLFTQGIRAMINEIRRYPELVRSR